MPIAAAIASLLPPPTAPEEAYRPAFDALADLLLRRAVLVAAGVRHRLIEIELYYHGGHHLDEFSHRDPIQRDIGLWYFHRQGPSYRGGSYKGVDVTFGRRGSQGDDHFGGILLRAIEPMDPVGSPHRSDRSDRHGLIEGPSRLVDHLLALTGRPTVAALAGAIDLHVDAPASPLVLRADPPSKSAPFVLATPRVGLTLKRGDLARRRRFIARAYRYLTDPARLGKGRPQIVVALHRRGLTVEDIARTAGVRAGVAARWVDAYQAGQGGDPMESLAGLRGDLSPPALCKLLGACATDW